MNLRHILLCLCLLAGINASAYDAEIDGIYYNFSEDEAEVTYSDYNNNSYSGAVIIPESVTYNGKTYSVTTIGSSAFSDSKLSSISIPESVTTIGSSAFSRCYGLTSISIPESVTTIGSGAFWFCDRLDTIHIPKSVTSIGDGWTFGGCKPSSITVAEGNPNYDSRNNCNAIIETATNTLVTGCKSTIIPNSVTSIGDYAFNTNSWDNAIIPSSVTTIGNGAFYQCSGITSIIIPNGVTSIGYDTFLRCHDLTSVTIPESVRSIGRSAFAQCSKLTDVYCYAENVPEMFDDYSGGNIFGGTPIENATLHVPAYVLEAYKTTEPWSGFGVFDPIVLKCATPTIGYANGKLTFKCETEDVAFIYNIKDDDIKYGAGSEVDLCVAYQISVYATKGGIANSDVATATLCWVDQQPEAEGLTDEDAVLEMKALPVLIQTQGSTITVQGAANGTQIYVYATDGMQQATAIAVGGGATLNTSLQPGSVAIVKIGERTIKVLMK